MEPFNWLQATGQTTLAFFSLLAFTRLMGKTQIGQLTFYEYVTGITLGSLTANITAAPPAEVWRHYYHLVLFIAFAYALSWLTLHSRLLRHAVQGTPTLLIAHGQLQKAALRQNRFDLEKLFSQLRQQGVLDLAEVQFAVLEPTGELSIVLHSAHQPVKRRDVNLPEQNSALPRTLILDGQIVSDSLSGKKADIAWLQIQLQKRGIAGPQQVLYAAFDSQGMLQIIRQPRRSPD